jgi:hypothetical protein
MVLSTILNGILEGKILCLGFLIIQSLNFFQFWKMGFLSLFR